MVSGVELELSPDFLMFVEMNRFYVTSAGFHMLYKFPHFSTFNKRVDGHRVQRRCVCR